MTLCPDSIHLYYLAFDSKHLYSMDKCYGAITQKEKQKSQGFKQEIHQKNYVITHAYLRLILSQYYPEVAPKKWEFVTNEFGKPRLRDSYGITLHFNLSHTDKGVAFIFTFLGACGIDIEEPKKMLLDNGLIDVVLSENEKNVYMASSKKTRLFYRIWTLKEAYVKALGQSLDSVLGTSIYSNIGIFEGDDEVGFCYNRYTVTSFFLEKEVPLSYAIGKTSILVKPKFFTLGEAKIGTHKLPVACHNFLHHRLLQYDLLKDL